ncbi:hypothetical protein GCM10010178_35370 [Lentzea flava]|uniref:Uncharacterized protein n=1 Tax=Lentzea flava TaxID=103732 RepID=A0ABQ2UJ17_9PSEU|nr:hypothetical protein GCM10010178_35370 [Lentzea flava]
MPSIEMITSVVAIGLAVRPTLDLMIALRGTRPGERAKIIAALRSGGLHRRLRRGADDEAQPLSDE